MKPNLKRIKWRLKLYSRDPHCYWCGNLTQYCLPTLHDGPDDMATVDHIFAKYERVKGNNPKVLACRRCNRDRAAIQKFRKGLLFPRIHPGIEKSF